MSKRSFVDLPTRGPRWIGIDAGLKRVGLACSDETGQYARPMAVASPKETLHLLRHVEREVGLRGMVLGWPLERDGSEGKGVDRVRPFEQLLLDAFPTVRLHRQDERYTTVDARALLEERAAPLPKRTSGAYDALAAMLILEIFLSEGDHEA